LRSSSSSGFGQWGWLAALERDQPVPLWRARFSPGRAMTVHLALGSK